MSKNSVSQPTTSDGTAALVAAAAALAQYTIDVHGAERADGETGQRWLPLATMDALVAIDPFGVWTVIIYAPNPNGMGMLECAVVAGLHVEERVMGAHLDMRGDVPSDPSRHAQAAREIRAVLAQPAEEKAA